MRLLILLPSRGRGGAEGYALTIAQAALQKGWDVHLAMQHTAETASLIEDFCALSVSYHPLAIGEVHDPKVETAGKHMLRCVKTAELLIRLKPDVVQIVLPWQNLGRGSVFACGLLKIPTMVVFQLAPQKLSFSARMQSLYAWAQARNQRWVAVSEHNRRIISQSFNLPLGCIHRIYNGASSKASLAGNSQEQDTPTVEQTVEQIVEQTVEPTTALRDRIRQELGLPQDSRIILTVGRLCWQKGYHLLGQTVSHLIRNFPDIHFVWVGTGEFQAELTQQLQDYGVAEKVTLLGRRSDIPDLLQASDLFVFPTLYEGQPFALLEALSMGCPVVSTDASGIPEIITHNVHGVLCRTDDSCDLFNAIHWALQHPIQMQEMAHRAIDRAAEFSEARMLQETLEHLQKLSECEEKPTVVSLNSLEQHGKPDFAGY
ncbi:glycosyltransferase family 4 protein [Leptolyngbya ohadii]|uniref:glycosyltransferase family 4 protein n=1 Tax=Leptolyngbya ohadii TaxID=1962290 RepID=UPI0015C59D81|nr:glycosyltransferase family 4 protein [Leptolyngbya ohadii]